MIFFLHIFKICIIFAEKFKTQNIILMKKNYFLLFALVASITMSLKAASIVSVQDQSVAEWDMLPAEYVVEAVCPTDAALPALKSMKVYADGRYLNLLVEPDMALLPDLEYVPFHIYIDTDNSDQTGGYGDLFADANADIVLEAGVFLYGEPVGYNPAVFKWWGEVGGNGWQWVDPDVYHDMDDFWGAIVGEGDAPIGASQFVDGKLEIQIDRALIPAIWNETTFGIGVDVQQSWMAVGLLPQGSRVANTGEPFHDCGLTNKLKVRIDGSAVAVEVVDGVRYLLDEAALSAQVIGFSNLGSSVTFPAEITVGETVYSVSSLLGSAFAGHGNLKTIVLESETPLPVDGNGLSGLPQNVVIYVPDEAVEAYLQDAFWGQYAIHPKSAQATDTNVIVVSASEDAVNIIWPVVEGAESYEMVIVDKNGNLVCTLIFNANGQLTSIVFHAPARNKAPQQTHSSGFAFTVNGLESGTNYNLTITAKDINGNVVGTETMAFVTRGQQGIDVVDDGSSINKKILREGMIRILRGDKTYNAAGQEIR